MSFEQGRDTFEAIRGPNSAGSREDGELPLPPPPKPAAASGGDVLDAESRERLDHVLQSDIGITTLLNRLKQSTGSAKDFASFLKERAALEEKHAQGLKRLSRGTHEAIRRPESKGGSFAHNYEELTLIHDRMSDNGVTFASNLYQMHDELQELAANCERGRKHWKQTGLNAEKRVQDAESSMDKAKGKYNALADQYDRARTGERQSGKFGLKGPKSAAQQEEDLHRKLEIADAEYGSKVQSAQSQRHELLNQHRPQAVGALQDLIQECDAGLSMQISRYASLNEKLLLGNGLCVSPLKGQATGPAIGRSLREVAQSIDNRKDFHDYVLGFSNKAGTRPADIRYEKHPALSPKQQQHTQSPAQPSFNPASPTFGSPERKNTGFETYTPGHRPSQSGQITGVLPYQAPGGDRAQMPGQPGGSYPPGPHQPVQNPNSAQLPQLPPIEAFSMGGGLDAGNKMDMKSPAGPSTDLRQGPTVQPQTRTDAPPVSGPGSSSNFHSPQNSVQTHNQQVTVPTGGPSNTYGTGPAPGSGPRPSGPPQGFGYPSDPRGPLQGSGYPSDPRGAPPGSGYQSDPRGQAAGQVRVSQPGAGSRGPSLGQSGDFRSDNRGVPYGQPGFPAADNRGPPGPPNGGYRAPPQSGLQTIPPSNIVPNPVVAALPSNQRRQDAPMRNLPPLKPVFGVPLDELFRRDGVAVPEIVYQCVQAVDLFGLETEGVYRTSGSAPHIMEMKALFDHDSSQVDFRNPAAFHHDIASVTTLLKHFFRDLPDPLLTTTQYSAFIEAGKLEEDIVRRDTLHAIINNLPDSNYATLRVLVLHLHRVASRSDINRMTPSNLAICFGPTLMGQQNGAAGDAANGNGSAAPSTIGGDIRDAGWQARVIETILNNSLDIFEEDE